MIAGTEKMAWRTWEAAELHNVIRVGDDGNYGHPQVQLNIAEACEEDSGELQTLHSKASSRSLTTRLVTGGSLGVSMGTFGDDHIDSKDHAGAPTNMTILSNFPQWVHQGFFFLLEIGVAYKLDYLLSMFFSGLRRHCGTPPTYAKGRGSELPKGSNRLAVIGYPSAAHFNGTSGFALAAGPAGPGKTEAVRVRAEAINIDR